MFFVPFTKIPKISMWICCLRCHIGWETAHFFSNISAFRLKITGSVKVSIHVNLVKYKIFHQSDALHCLHPAHSHFACKLNCTVRNHSLHWFNSIHSVDTLFIHQTQFLFELRLCTSIKLWLLWLLHLLISWPSACHEIKVHCSHKRLNQVYFDWV